MRTLLHNLLHWHKWATVRQVKGHVPFTYVHSVRRCDICGVCESGMLHWGGFREGWFNDNFSPIEHSDVATYMDEKQVQEETRAREYKEYKQNSIRHALKVLRRYSD